MLYIFNKLSIFSVLHHQGLYLIYNHDELQLIWFLARFYWIRKKIPDVTIFFFSLLVSSPPFWYSQSFHMVSDYSRSLHLFRIFSTTGWAQWWCRDPALHPDNSVCRSLFPFRFWRFLSSYVMKIFKDIVVLLLRYCHLFRLICCIYECCQLRLCVWYR